MTRKAPAHTQFHGFAILLALFLAVPLNAYDDIPTSENSIRDAYFLGTRQGGLTPEFLARYAHWIPELKEGSCTSQVRLESPFLQVADYASKAPNLSAQDAVKQFYGQADGFSRFSGHLLQAKCPAEHHQNQSLSEQKRDCSIVYGEQSLRSASRRTRNSSC